MEFSWVICAGALKSQETLKVGEGEQEVRVMWSEKGPPAALGFEDEGNASRALECG